MSNLTDQEILALAADIIFSRDIKGKAITAPADSVEFLRHKLGGKDHEVFAVLFLDTRHQVIQFEELFRGTIDTSAVYPREVVKQALLLNAATVIFSHNHPSGVAQPSTSDIAITRRLKEACALLDIRVLDHIIIAGSSSYSFAEHGHL